MLLMYFSMAIVIEGVSGVGALISILNFALSAASSRRRLAPRSARLDARRHSRTHVQLSTSKNAP